MDSQTETNCSISLQLPNMLKEAQEMMEKGQRKVLISLIGLIPTIKKLNQRGVDFQRISNEEIDTIRNIAQISGTHHERKHSQIFRSNLDQLIQAYYRDSKENNNRNNFLPLQKMSESLRLFILDSNHIFTKYLMQVSEASTLINDFKLNEDFQRSVIDKYIKEIQGHLYSQENFSLAPKIRQRCNSRIKEGLEKRNYSASQRKISNGQTKIASKEKKNQQGLATLVEKLKRLLK